jgi:hypothetical protein
MPRDISLRYLETRQSAPDGTRTRVCGLLDRCSWAPLAFTEQYPAGRNGTYSPNKRTTVGAAARLRSKIQIVTVTFELRALVRTS